jgi:cytochrome c peroxidase
VRRLIGVVCALGAAWLAAGTTPLRADQLLLTQPEIELLIAHGPWPAAPAPDPSNRVSGQPAAIDLGRRLFFDPRLSGPGTVSCATCHDPAKGWTDGRPRAQSLARADRNTQSLYNLAGNRWFGWDGRTDSLWAHSIGPIVDAREMAADAGHVARLVTTDLSLAGLYRAAFGAAPNVGDPDGVLVDAAKALAAFQETIVSGPTPFDVFRNALASGNRSAAAAYPQAAQRGAALFVGRGKCNFCHVGPAFSNGEFSDAGVPYFIEPGRVDPGRHGGIVKLKASPYSLTGRHNDDPARTTAWATRHVAELHTNFGAFKVPSLRNLIRTAPYMHDGSRATLADVVRHYSELNPERLHADGEKILEPLALTSTEVSDLVAFLETLSPQ